MESKEEENNHANEQRIHQITQLMQLARVLITVTVKNDDPYLILILMICDGA